MIISIFTPHGGCPERCRFCDQATSGGTPVSARHVQDTIEAHLKTSRDGKAEEIAFYGGTFTAMPKERQLAYLEAAAPYLLSGKIGAVRISTRPDALDEAWLLKLKNEYGLKTVELGAQSFETQVLEALGRSHSGADTIAAVGLLKRLGLTIGLHFMVGCPSEPNDSRAYDNALIAKLCELRPDLIRIHPLLVLEDTALADAYRKGEFIPLDLETAVERIALICEGLEGTGIKVIRLGLQPNELLGEALVAGPYHPAFGELVGSRRLRLRLTRLIEKELANTCNDKKRSVTGLEILSPKRLQSQAQGQKRANLEWFRRKFKLPETWLSVLESPSTLYDDVQIRIHYTYRSS
jgi:histone acetyltransferase (RNA polymerase elongator complex component)